MAKKVLGKDPFERNKSANTSKPKKKSAKSSSKSAEAASTKKSASKLSKQPAKKISKSASSTTTKSKKKPEETPVIQQESAVSSSVSTTNAPEAAGDSRGVSWKSFKDDGFGLDPEFVEKTSPIIDFLYSKWWRVEVEGIGNIPREGRVMLVGNHAGILPYDSLMVQDAVRREHPEHRLVRPLLEDFVYYFPYVGTAMSKLGAVRACQENGQLLLGREEAVLVFPEGIKGIVKPWKKRYQLQRFGRGGFVRLAILAKSPIVPVAIIGSEETHPMLKNMEQAAKLFGLPYMPITPTFPWLGPAGLVPLPAKWKIVFGKPIPFDGYLPDQIHDRILVNKLVERVRSRIQSMIDKVLAERRSIWT